MMKVFVVTAYYSDYEWQREDLVGVYDSLLGAETAKKMYEKHLDEIRALESPLTEEEQEIDTKDLPDDRWDIWWAWSQRRNEIMYFENIKIQEIELNGKPILYE